jgi:hypothetical protein
MDSEHGVLTALREIKAPCEQSEHCKGRRNELTADHITPLRQMLQDIDARLLKHLTGPHPLSDVALQQVATLESARSAVLRLLTAAEQEARP